MEIELQKKLHEFYNITSTLMYNLRANDSAEYRFNPPIAGFDSYADLIEELRDRLSAILKASEFLDKYDALTPDGKMQFLKNNSISVKEPERGFIMSNVIKMREHLGTNIEFINKPEILAGLAQVLTKLNAKVIEKKGPLTVELDSVHPGSQPLPRTEQLQQEEIDPVLQPFIDQLEALNSEFQKLSENVNPGLGLEKRIKNLLMQTQDFIDKFAMINEKTQNKLAAVLFRTHFVLSQKNSKIAANVVAEQKQTVQGPNPNKRTRLETKHLGIDDILRHLEGLWQPSAEELKAYFFMPIPDLDKQPLQMRIGTEELGGLKDFKTLFAALKSDAQEEQPLPKKPPSPRLNRS